MLKKKKTRSLRFKIWGCFIVFTIFIMAALWLLQIVFLNSFYTKTKMNELQKTAETVAASYEAGNLPEASVSQFYGPGITVRIVDAGGNSHDRPNNPGGAPERDEPSVSAVLAKLIQSADGTVSASTSVPHSAGKTLIYGITLSGNSGGNKYLLVSTQINLADSPAALLQEQLIIVMIIALALSVAISMLIASRLAGPIAKITNTASKLAEGNYDIHFENGGYTEIDQLASTLNYATNELSKTNKLQRELIANVSHDLRTPLTMVKMYAELIRDVSGDRADKRSAHTQVIIEESDRLNALITDILDLSKLQSGTSQMNRTEFDLSDKTRVILNRFKALSEHSGYVFEFHCEEDALVYADAPKIEQVIYNLISNAVNYTGDDKKIFIDVVKKEGKVRFAVRDTGLGIPQEELEHIWERYYKSDNSHKREVVGTGLGLSIVKGILEAHDAPFGVSSAIGSTGGGTVGSAIGSTGGGTDGAGSTFWFELSMI
jgi:signal transduction histidine kinase